MFNRSQISIKRPIGGYPYIKIPIMSETPVWTMVLSDLHIGHPASRLSMLYKALEWAKNHDAILFYGGDWIENGTKTSVGTAVYKQMSNPHEQLEQVCKIMEPYKKQFVAGIRGNHEARTEVQGGIDPAQIICDKLDIPYFGFEVFGSFHLKTQEDAKGRVITFFINHSNSGHKSSGLAINAVQRDWSFIDVDLKFKCHDHHADYSGDKKVLRLNPNGATVTGFQEHVVLTGSILDRPESYAQKKPHNPGRLGFLPVCLNPADRRPERTFDWSVRPSFELVEG